MWKNRYGSTRIVSLFIALMALAALAPEAQAQLSETKLVASDAMDGDFFGQAVAIDGNRAVVGVPFADLGNDENAGAAYVFERIDGQWREVDKFTASDADSTDFLGSAVAISGSHVIAGAPGSLFDSNPDPGAAYLFKIFNRDPGGLSSGAELPQPVQPGDGDQLWVGGVWGGASGGVRRAGS